MQLRPLNIAYADVQELRSRTSKNIALAILAFQKHGQKVEHAVQRASFAFASSLTCKNML